MSRKGYITSALCPFYKRETRSEVCCHGWLPSSNVHVTFGDPAEAYGHKAALCHHDYNACPVYQMLTGESQKREGP